MDLYSRGPLVAVLERGVMSHDLLQEVEFGSLFSTFETNRTPGEKVSWTAVTRREQRGQIDHKEMNHQSFSESASLDRI